MSVRRVATQAALPIRVLGCERRNRRDETASSDIGKVVQTDEPEHLAREDLTVDCAKSKSKAAAQVDPTTAHFAPTCSMPSTCSSPRVIAPSRPPKRRWALWTSRASKRLKIPPSFASTKCQCKPTCSLTSRSPACFRKLKRSKCTAPRPTAAPSPLAQRPNRWCEGGAQEKTEPLHARGWVVMKSGLKTSSRPRSGSAYLRNSTFYGWKQSFSACSSSDVPEGRGPNIDSHPICKLCRNHACSVRAFRGTHIRRERGPIALEVPRPR